MRAHPLADIFPMLPDNELQELAADIKENGLLNAITQTEWTDPTIEDAAPEDVTVDGRNRLKACEIAGVEPRFQRLPDGVSIEAFILANNVLRRHMSKGQLAMAVAMLYPEAEAGGRGRNVGARLALETSGFSSQRLRQARMILHLKPLLAAAVVRGDERFDDALRVVQDEQRAAVAKERAGDTLRRRAPDLAARVAEEQITPAEAMTILNEREQVEKNVRITLFHMLKSFTTLCEQIVSTSGFEELPEWLRDDDFRQDFCTYFPRGAADFLAKQTAMHAAVEKLLDLMESLTEEN